MLAWTKGRRDPLRVLVSDTSVIIDLERGALLQELFRLPLVFVVPDLLYHRELRGPIGDQLVAWGLRVEELSPTELARATTVRRAHTALSVPDTFAFALAESRTWALLTGDGLLRRLAVEEKIQVHGVLWLLDQLEAGKHLSANQLHTALTAIAVHPRCRLPVTEIRKRLTRYAES
jgi:hypothetical protein